MAHQSGHPRGASRFFTCSWCETAIRSRGELPKAAFSPNYGICSPCLERKIADLGGFTRREGAGSASSAAAPTDGT